MHKVNNKSLNAQMACRRIAVFGFSLLLACSPSVYAVSSISLGANVPANCTFNGGGSSLDFGNYDPSTNNIHTALTSALTFSIKCTKGSSATISISDGSYTQGNMRRMRGKANNFLDYNLYTDSGRTVIWNMSNTVNYTALHSAPKTFTVYGKVPAGQDNIGAGSYSDIVTVNITF